MCIRDRLYFLHRGLKLCSTSVLYPFVFCIYNIIAIMDGLIYFEQTSRLPALHAGLIAVGTVILLAGVFALSWRLDDDSAAPPADAHSLLTPGMGIVEDTTTDDEDSDGDSTIIVNDEEAVLGSTERTPLLAHGRTMSLTAQDNAILKVTKKRRQRFAAEADEIWDELQDENHPIHRTWSFVARRSAGKKRSQTMSAVEDGRIRGSSDSLAGLPLKRGSTIASGREKDRQRRRSQFGIRHRSASSPLPKRRRADTARSDLRPLSRGSVFLEGISSWWKHRRSDDDHVRSESPSEERTGNG